MNPPIVLITVDCLRADHVGCYGYDRPTTPNIDAFVQENDVALYSYAYANCPGTRWAFQTIHCGVYMDQIVGAGVPNSYKSTLAQKLSENGYKTGGFTRNGFLSREYNYNIGFDDFIDMTFLDQDKDKVVSTGRKISDLIGSDFLREHIMLPAYRWYKQTGNEDFIPSNPDSAVAGTAAEWAAKHDGKSYFLWFHSMDAHTPYGRWKDHLTAIRGDTDIQHTIHPGHEGLVKEGNEPDEAVVDTYDASIRSADAAIGEILNTISDETIVIITGDHGEEFGRYGEFHRGSLYSSFTQVPFIIRHPDLDAGVHNDEWVQHLDIPPTLLGTVNNNPPPVWRGENIVKTKHQLGSPVFFSLTEERCGIREENWKLIEQNESFLLFQTGHGKDDSSDVSSKYPHRVQDLQTRLKQWKSSLETVGNGVGGDNLEEADELSDNVRENLEELGYLDS